MTQSNHNHVLSWQFLWVRNVGGAWLGVSPEVADRVLIGRQNFGKSDQAGGCLQGW